MTLKKVNYQVRERKTFLKQTLDKIWPSQPACLLWTLPSARLDGISSDLLPSFCELCSPFSWVISYPQTCSPSFFPTVAGGAGNAIRHAHPRIHEQHREHHEAVVGPRAQRLQPERLWVPEALLSPPQNTFAGPVWPFLFSLQHRACGDERMRKKRRKKKDGWELLQPGTLL